MQTPIVLHADPEHGGLQAAIPLVLVASLVLAYLLLLFIFPSVFGGQRLDYLLLAACGALPLALGATAVGDLLLKRVWHSGRRLVYDEHSLTIEQPDKGNIRIDLGEPYQVLRWQFKMEPFPRFGRERQIKNGWFCLACQLQQAAEKVTVHAFLNPRQAAGQLAQSRYQPLDMSTIHDASMLNRVRQLRTPRGRPDIPSSLIVGEHGRYWLAERRRWEAGMELSPRDFMTLMAIVDNHLPKS